MLSPSIPNVLAPLVLPLPEISFSEEPIMKPPRGPGLSPQPGSIFSQSPQPSLTRQGDGRQRGRGSDRGGWEDAPLDSCKSMLLASSINVASVLTSQVQAGSARPIDNPPRE